jgi:gamma-glutamylcyclotransferase (GGCT)/AIG2-like uncharacterized protein YtfP
MKKDILYIAYGSNLNLKQMRGRCPKATPLHSMMLPNFRLVFKGVADIVEEPDMEVPVGVFKITEDCEKALDRYEGYPRLYSKIHFTMQGKLLMAYVMNHSEISPPSTGYYESIKQGYKDFNLDLKYLEHAKRHSYTNGRYGGELWG